MKKHDLLLSVSLVLCLVTLPTGFASCTTPEENMEAVMQETEALVTALQDGDAEIRYAAARDAWRIGPHAIEPVGALLASTDPGQALSAQQALWSIVHHACRPGEKSDRRACSNELLALVNKSALPVELPLKARHEILRMLSFTVNDSHSVRGLDALLDDTDLAGMALFALERVDHAAADEVLTQRLAKKSALPKAAVAGVLGQRRTRGAVSSLLVLVESDDKAAAAAALRSLAMIAPARAEVEAALRAATAHQEPDSVDNLLLFADGRLAAGDRDKAAGIYALYTKYRSAHVRAAAVRGLGRAGGSDEFALLIAMLGDKAPAVRAEARKAIVSIEEEIGDQLAAAYEASEPLARAALLGVMVDRNEEAAIKKVKEALTDEAAPVRLAALDLAGTFDNNGFEPLLIEAAAGAEGDESDRAYSSYLALAAARFAAGDRPGALEMFHTVCDKATTRSILGEALNGVAAVADRASLGRVEKLAADTALREPVGRARLAIATGLVAEEPHKARELLELVCFKSGSRTLRTSALGLLGELGVDTKGYARRQGFIPEWILIGPFPEATKETLGSHPFEEPYPNPDKPFLWEGKELTWTPFATDDMDGMVDLLFIKPNQNVCAYAHGTFWHPDGGDGMIKVGSDDGVALWLNGELVHENYAWRGATPDSDKIKVRFRAGRNKVLVKVHQGGGDWRFCVRIADAEGGPIDLGKKR